MDIRTLALCSSLLPLLQPASALELNQTLTAEEVASPPASVRFLIYDGQDSSTPIRIADFGAGEFRQESLGENIHLSASLDEPFAQTDLWIETEIDGQRVGERQAIRAATFPNPSAFRISSANGVLFEGVGTGGIPAEGGGARMMWYPGKSAFRAGYVNGTQWDNDNVGYYSTAMGAGTTASGDYSTAMGGYTTASGIFSTAMGYSTTASDYYSTAMGGHTTASGNYSTAMGYSTTASGSVSTAMGSSTTASGSGSTAMGSSTTASGYYSTAMGQFTTASGYSSTAMGYDTTASGSYSAAMGRRAKTQTSGGAVHDGTFVWADSTNADFYSTAYNEFSARATGGCAS